MIKGHGLARWKIKWNREQHQKGKERERKMERREGRENDEEWAKSHILLPLARVHKQGKEEVEDELGVPREMSPPV